jgi:hypothetical protein
MKSREIAIRHRTAGQRRQGNHGIASVVDKLADARSRAGKSSERPLGFVSSVVADWIRRMGALLASGESNR